MTVEEQQVDEVGGPRFVKGAVVPPGFPESTVVGLARRLIALEGRVEALAEALRTLAELER